MEGALFQGLAWGVGETMEAGVQGLGCSRRSGKQDGSCGRV